ncbi:MAG: 4-alpha-glucanotransferase [bacterium]
MNERKSGLLLHPTSLPGNGFTGTFGNEAEKFIDFLNKSGQRLWQILPLHPCGKEGSPYNVSSVFAINPHFINTFRLVRDGLADRKDIPSEKSERCNYKKADEYVDSITEKAFARFLTKKNMHADFDGFKEKNLQWLKPYALYVELSDKFKTHEWNRWPFEYRRYDSGKVNSFYEKEFKRVEKQMFVQWLCFRQWREIKNYASQKDVEIVGDMPFFVSDFSCDTWCHPEFFQMENGIKTACAGVPPDYFSEKGQLWGNPLYDWKNLAEIGYDWWIKRFKKAVDIYDIVRIDHFRGFSACWKISPEAEDATAGEWETVPGGEMFSSVKKELPEMAVIAEDLGEITDDVKKLRDKNGFYGMKILQFAFNEGASSSFLPHNYDSSSVVVYTGTHDNETICEWYDKLDGNTRSFVDKYTENNSKNSIDRAMIRLAEASVADWCIFPVQDILELGSEARMNIPGTMGKNNWTWRMREGALRKEHAEMLMEFSNIYGRV